MRGTATHFASSGRGRFGGASLGVRPSHARFATSSAASAEKIPAWGAPRIHGELLKLGINIGETSVSKYLVRNRKPPSQTWRTFLENHLKSLVSVDFFTVPTIRFKILYVFLVLAHERRRILHFAVTAHPTAEWTAQQLREKVSGLGARQEHDVSRYSKDLLLLITPPGTSTRGLVLGQQTAVCAEPVR